MGDARAFESIVARVDYPMYIVTTVAGGERSGCLVGFATQSSIHPPRFLACISDKNHTFRVAASADALAVHLIPAGAKPLAELFGGATEDEVDKFGRVPWTPGPEGLPLLNECPSWFAGRILERAPLGDHVGHLLEPFAGEDPGGDYLPFSGTRGIKPGHEA